MSDSSTAQWIGRSLEHDRYQIDSVLGEGGMGTVYLADDRKLKQQVVVKMPHLYLLRDESTKQRFLREVRALVDLPHAHVVRIIDVGEVDETPYMVMQYLSGGSLESLLPKLQTASLPQRLATLNRWLPQIASALDYVHSKGVLHRDLKPANILFDQSWNPFLSDFGIARSIADDENRQQGLTGTGMVVGTQGYMPLEMLLGKPVDGRADQFALAVMVYEALSGSRPFAGETAAECAVSMSTTTPVLLHEVDAGIPLALSRTVHRGLSTEPQERFDRCEVFSGQVLAAASGSGPPVKPPVKTGSGREAGRDSNHAQQAIGTIKEPIAPLSKPVRTPTIKEPIGPSLTPVRTLTIREPMASTPPSLPSQLTDTVSQQDESKTVNSDSRENFLTKHGEHRNFPAFCVWDLQRRWRSVANPKTRVLGFVVVCCVLMGIRVLRAENPPNPWARDFWIFNGLAGSLIVGCVLLLWSYEYLNLPRDFRRPWILIGTIVFFLSLTIMAVDAAFLGRNDPLSAIGFCGLNGGVFVLLLGSISRFITNRNVASKPYPALTKLAICSIVFAIVSVVVLQFFRD